MKNKLFHVLFALPVTTGICGALLRASQYRHAYDVQSGILRSGEPVTYGLVAVCAVAFLLALMAAFVARRGTDFKSEKAGASVSVSLYVAAVIILAYAAMLLFSLREKFDATSLVLALFSIYCAVSFLALGKYKLEPRDSTAYCVFSAVPSFWACFMLILTFRENIADPIIANYLPLIFSYLAIVFFCYSISAHILGKDRRYVAVFFCFFGIFFILMELLSPLFAREYLTISAQTIRRSLPQLAFLILMPPVTAQMLKK